MVSIAPTCNRLIALVTLVATILVLSPSAAGAQDGCGTHSFGFAGTRLLNDGISTMAGPFAIELPAGTYDVTLVGTDDHSTQAQPSQTEEQWYVRLDGTWTSPTTSDLPDNLDSMTTTFPALDVPAATSISVHHRGVGNVNSIDVLCVGFTPVSVEEPPVDDPTTEEPTSEIAPPVDPIIPDPADSSDAPDIAAPDTTPPAVEIAPPVGPIVNPPADIPADAPAPADAPDDVPAIEIAGPKADLAPPTSPVEPEVLGAIETPAPQLALTGPNDLLWTLTFGGLAMIALGIGLVTREQRIRA